MAEDLVYASAGGESNKRKYEDSPSPVARRTTGFSSTPDSAAPPSSYNSVPPPMNEIELAKQKAQEIAARLLNNADPSKRARPENGAGFGGGFDAGFPYCRLLVCVYIWVYSLFGDFVILEVYCIGQKHLGLGLTGVPQSASPGYPGQNKKIEIPNGRVGVIIGKGGVELMGTPDQIAKAEQLINDVLSEVGLVIGKGGETIRNMQAKTGARIQVIPLHLPPGDMSKERTVQIDGTSEQIEAAKQLVNEVTSESIAYLFGRVQMAPGSEFILCCSFSGRENPLGLEVVGQLVTPTWAHFMLVFPRHCSVWNVDAMGSRFIFYNNFMQNRVRNPSASGGYPQQGYQARPPSNWAQPGASVQQPGYGYVQPGAYPGPPQYNMNQHPYSGYPPQPASGGYGTGWDQSTAQNQQAAQGGSYDYYSQQAPSQQQQSHGGTGAPTDSSGYGYGQAPPYSQPQGYGQDGYGGYNVGTAQSAYNQPQANPSAGYDQQQQGYNSTYGNASNPTSDGHTASYGTQGDTNQAPAPGQSYNAGGQPSPTSNYPPQASIQPGYGVPPSSQGGYGTQPPSGYGSYGTPQAQKPSSQPTYAQPQQSPSAQGGSYAQTGYTHSQPPPAQPGYPQTDSSAQRPPSSGYPTSHPGYGVYGAPQATQTGYGQQQAPPYNSAYSGGYSQPPVYSSDASSVDLQRLAHSAIGNLDLESILLRNNRDLKSSVLLKKEKAIYDGVETESTAWKDRGSFKHRGQEWRRLLQAIDGEEQAIHSESTFCGDLPTFGKPAVFYSPRQFYGALQDVVRIDIPGRYESFWKELDSVKQLLKHRNELNIENAGIAALFGIECFAWFCAGEIVGRGFTLTGYHV
ncbi:UNVERIFIED_CONTAM: hypothetical protein Sradi_5588300 [Sesamum radiatum]|uniref:K Homology domain-containing protein n=1 Tax=Sesamum radiatum TaxID=300843 RepID=A0AAW2L117_SESRA